MPDRVPAWLQKQVGWGSWLRHAPISSYLCADSEPRHSSDIRTFFGIMAFWYQSCYETFSCLSYFKTSQLYFVHVYVEYPKLFLHLVWSSALARIHHLCQERLILWQHSAEIHWSRMEKALLSPMLGRWNLSRNEIICAGLKAEIEDTIGRRSRSMAWCEVREGSWVSGPVLIWVGAKNSLWLPVSFSSSWASSTYIGYSRGSQENLDTYFCNPRFCQPQLRTKNPKKKIEVLWLWVTLASLLFKPIII